MNLNSIAFAILVTLCIATTQTHPMIAYYLAALGGDACLIASSAALKVEQRIDNDKEGLIELGATQSHINQVNLDAARISPYASILAPVGTILAVGSRMGMFRKSGKGIALALLSLPLNSVLLAGGYAARLDLICDGESIS